ncbi:MAG: FG-GAP-like repeat-containing protein [Mariprofundaceae bacterium]|nr:FG-GAP-like repeat-containing protein [Mariprofundaceae bacterium]
MNRGIVSRRLFALSVACLLLGVAACRTTVPEPTMKVAVSSKSIPNYSMHNIGPPRVRRSFAAHFTDLNKDGNVDLVVGERKPDSGFRIEWGDGKGHWRIQDVPGTTGADMEPRASAVADMDGDGKLEILVGGQGDQKGLQVWKADAKGNYYLQSSPTETGDFRDVAFADLNEDGWPDIVGVRGDSQREGGIFIWLNNGRSGWIPYIGPMVEGVYTDMAVADINGDGHVDIVASRRGGYGAHGLSNGFWHQVGGVQIWLGDGGGSVRWEPKFLPTESDAESVTVADVNGDGRLDIVAGLYQQGIDLFLATKDGWDKRRVTDKGTWGKLRVGDLDGDGRRELVAASIVGQGLGLWQWSGGGTLGDGEFHALTGWLPDHGVYIDLDLGDVYGKGTLDTAALRADGALEVWSVRKSTPLPVKRFAGLPIGEPLSMYFDTASAHLDALKSQDVDAWLASLGEESKNLYFRIRGKADIRSIHTEVFPSNEALSRARAESVEAILRGHGIPSAQMTIEALGDRGPAPPGLDPEALRQNRYAWVQAYPLRSVRIPPFVKAPPHGDLYHIAETKSFKTIHGIPEYKVGPGDELSITLWQGGKPEIHLVTVQIDGTVSLPFFEAVPVDKMTPSEIDASMTELLKKLVRHPRVDVLVLKPKSKTATIFGRIRDLIRQPTGPGTYFLIGKETLVDFISRVGGPIKDADLTKVQLIRDGKTILLNLERAIKQADWRENAIIKDRDTIFVPSTTHSKRRVYVLGQVKKPGIVEYDGNIHFLDAVSKSGGFDKNPYYPDIRVIRADRDKPLILAVNFKRLLEQGDLTQNLALRDKDIIIVPRSPVGNWNQYIKNISPTLDLLVFKPLSAVAEFQTIRDLNNRINVVR